jgi:acyl CoA:acetate/3-ketoacid CoA transferase beta subunit
LVLTEVAPGLTADDVQSATEPTLILSPTLKVMEG